MSGILHIVPGVKELNSGITVAVRLMATSKDSIRDAREVNAYLRGCEAKEVWVHSVWLPSVWKACLLAKKYGKHLVRMPHGNLDPVRLKYHWLRKWLVGPIERYFLRKADKIVATCDAEKEWIEAYLGKRCPEIVVEDIKRFFKLGVRSEELGVRGEGIWEPCRGVEGESLAVSGQRLAVRGQGIRPLRVLATHRDASKPSDREAELGVSGDGCNSELDTRDRELHVLYLGRRHPLKGVEFLETAVAELNSSTPPLLKIVSNAFGEELEKAWEWCDVLVLPTLSENFGLVVAEALERGKRVITTDGAPVWGEESDGVEEWVSDGVMEWRSGGVESRYGGRLLYLKGYRDGSEEERVELLKKAILFLAAKNAKDA